MSKLKDDYISIPKSEYELLKDIYKSNKKQMELTRIYEVEENIKSLEYKKVSIDDFIDSI